MYRRKYYNGNINDDGDEQIGSLDLKRTRICVLVKENEALFNPMLACSLASYVTEIPRNPVMLNLQTNPFIIRD